MNLLITVSGHIPWTGFFFFGLEAHIFVINECYDLIFSSLIIFHSDLIRISDSAILFVSCIWKIKLLMYCVSEGSLRYIFSEE